MTTGQVGIRKLGHVGSVCQLAPLSVSSLVVNIFTILIFSISLLRW